MTKVVELDNKLHGNARIRRDLAIYTKRVNCGWSRGGQEKNIPAEAEAKAKYAISHPQRMLNAAEQVDKPAAATSKEYAAITKSSTIEEPEQQEPKNYPERADRSILGQPLLANLTPQPAWSCACPVQASNAILSTPVQASKACLPSVGKR